MKTAVLLNSLLTCATASCLCIATARADVISDWNNTAIVAIKAVNPNAVLASRALAMMHVAQFDAVNAVVRSYTPYAADLSAAGASPEAAAAQAAYVVLTNVYPTQLALLDAALSTSLGSVPDGQPKTDGIALGQATAAAVLALRANDGSGATLAYIPGSGPGVWIPTPPAFAPALLPNWRSVAPWTMTAPEQFRPGPPPALDSAIYTADFLEMKAVGETNSTTRTAEQTAIGLFHIEFVPYTLGSAARYAVAARPLPLIESARLFALLNLAMADSVIAVWDGKFHYNYWRPVTA
ncbi:MAG: vanadium-dependent haloperoxidase, partial [Verrucomicrobia bacterium]|nr:vanadium-dependent haloperoxidase [Verrucomicrobiota bacterium]